jgi:hypothetical protein
MSDFLISHIITINSRRYGINDLPRQFFQSAKSLRELHIYRDCVFETSIALQGLRNCHFDITMVEKLSVSYNPHWVGQNVFEDKLFVPSRLFNQDSQITHTESMSYGEKTQSWSVEKGERLLREIAGAAHVVLDDSLREMRDDLSEFIRELGGDERKLSEKLSDLKFHWQRWCYFGH